MQEEVRKSVFERDLWRCQRCGMPATELAHRVARTESNKKMIMKKYQMSGEQAEAVLDHPHNLQSSCRECNDYFNVGHKRHIADTITDVIVEKMVNP